MTDTVVHNFSLFTPAQLSHLKGALSLSMSDEMLAYCMKHYKAVEHRDPYTDELQALSVLSGELERLPDASCIYELSTSNEEIARTYADVIQKRKSNFSNVNNPPTLSEIAALATEELQRVGFPRRTRSIRAYDAPDAFFEDHVPSVTTASGAVRLRTAPTPVAGDVLVLLAPTTRDGGIERIPVTVKHSLRLGKNGLLSTLLTHFDGFSVNLTPFSDRCVTPPLTVLTGSTYCNSYVLCVAPKDLKALLTYMREREIPGFSFATLTASDTVTFLRHPEKPFSLRVNFLRSLFRRVRHTVAIEEDGATLARIDRMPIAPSSCAYLSGRGLRKGQESVFMGNVCCTAASAPIASAAFRTALYSALSPVLSQAACGIPTREQSLSVTVTYSSASEALAALLGVYRAQTELALTAHEYRLMPASEAHHAAVSVFSLSDAFPNTSHLTHVGATVYCLTVATDDNGLPIFSDLRAQLARLSELNGEFLISAVRVLINESVTEGLDNMSATLSYVPEENCDALPQRLPLAFLIESPAALPLPAVGRTVAREEAPLEDLPPVCPPKDSLIRSDRPEIVLLAKPDDKDAEALLSVLSSRGAHARLFLLSEDRTPLARALLGSHALILCKDAYPAEDPHLGFAIETLLRAGGSILALYECDDATVLSLPDGIPEEILETLLLNS